MFYTGRGVGEIIGISETEKIEYKAFLPIYEIAGKNYQNVKIFENKFHEIDNRLPRKTYYAKNVGVIRRELWNGQVWNLINYDVKQ